jgi:gamma-glutamyltranspeptidase/glutathione hydrolase
MVVAKQEAAARAGAQVLAEGGNAIDAVVTMGWCMAVMEPYQCTIGGAGYTVFRPVEGEPRVIEFTGRAPMASRQAHMGDRKPGQAFQGPLAIGVPGTVAGLSLALERFGTISLARAIEPAIRLAEEMPLDFFMALRISQCLLALRANRDSARAFLHGNDSPLTHGKHVIQQTDLARTLRAIADGGPRAFYEGEIGRELVRVVRERGGVLEESDLADYQANILPALRGRFRGYDLLGVPPPSPGLTTIESLQILDGFDLAGMGHNSADALHVIGEAYRLAFADRDAYLGDPDFGEIPVDGLLSDEFTASRRAEIGMERAMGEVRPGALGVPATGMAGGGGGTTNICAVDAAGNMVAHTQTCIGGFEGFGVAGSTGVIPSCSLNWFDAGVPAGPGAPNSLEPGKRPLTNMTPMIVERAGMPVLAVGSPGARRITNAVSQTVLNVLEFGMRPQVAVSAPRIDYSTSRLCADDRIDPDVLSELERRGHEVERVHEFISYGGAGAGFPGFMGHFARPNAILIDPDGARHGGDYPGAFGAVIGVDAG